MARYPKKTYDTGACRAALYPGRELDHVAIVRPQLPCTTIVVHGVNDVGVAYGEVEAGLCAGMAERLKLPPTAFVPVDYRTFTPQDRDRIDDDPDAIYFRRQPTTDAHSFVVPFYWGYREVQNQGKVRGGQSVDRFGNRLDKDLSKGGGPFVNATTTLPDMWNRGFGGARGAIDWKAGDPLRPMLDAPGRMYMVLAAMRLAALVSMIRDYDADETVNLVAHSQGCMLSLLAQAFLQQRGERPADALILTHPPYSLVDELGGLGTAAAWFHGGIDEAMKEHYPRIAGVQTLHARLQTLVNLVTAVAEKRRSSPSLETLKSPERCVVGARWSPAEDRDNRGKVYLYFCPEDATVGLDTVRGIGWQGVPNEAEGRKFAPSLTLYERRHEVVRSRFEPLAALGAAFRQRVFTARQRAPAGGGAAAPVSVGAAPHDFPLCLPGEAGWHHVDPSQRSLRAEVDPAHGARRINGEALGRPFAADLMAGAEVGSHGTKEAVDAIDAAVAPTSDHGPAERWLLVEDMPAASLPPYRQLDQPSPPGQTLHTGRVAPTGPQTRAAIEQHLNGRRPEGDQRRVLDAYLCLPTDALPPAATCKLLVRVTESPNETRFRFQHKQDAARSFHSAIFGSRANHRHVTAYDLAIGKGDAVSDPEFRAYLCAVADWRITSNDRNRRPVTTKWTDFLLEFAPFYEKEEKERKRRNESRSSKATAITTRPGSCQNGYRQLSTASRH